MKDYGSNQMVAVGEDQSLTEAVTSKSLTKELKEKYPIVCLLQFDADGEIKVLEYSGMSETELTEAIAQSKLSSLCQNVNVNDIKNAMFVLAVSKGADTVAKDYENDYGYSLYWYMDQRFPRIAFIFLVIVSLTAVILSITGMFKGKGERFLSIPVEAFFLVVHVISHLFEYIMHVNYIYNSGELSDRIHILIKDLGLGKNIFALDTTYTVALWILCFGGITFFLVNAIRIMKKGVKRILMENILLVRVIKIFFQHIFSRKALPK